MNKGKPGKKAAAAAAAHAVSRKQASAVQISSDNEARVKQALQVRSAFRQAPLTAARLTCKSMHCSAGTARPTSMHLCRNLRQAQRSARAIGVVDLRSAAAHRWQLHCPLPGSGRPWLPAGAHQAGTPGALDLVPPPAEACNAQLRFRSHNSAAAVLRLCVTVAHLSVLAVGRLLVPPTPAPSLFWTGSA